VRTCPFLPARWGSFFPSRSPRMRLAFMSLVVTVLRTSSCPKGVRCHGRSCATFVIAVWGVEPHGKDMPISDTKSVFG